jgi:hypothetical protein
VSRDLLSGQEAALPELGAAPLVGAAGRAAGAADTGRAPVARHWQRCRYLLFQTRDLHTPGQPSSSTAKAAPRETAHREPRQPWSPGDAPGGIDGAVCSLLDERGLWAGVLVVGSQWLHEMSRQGDR